MTIRLSQRMPWFATTIPLMMLVLLTRCTASAQCLKFDPITIDALASGDCKAIGDLLGSGRGDPILGGSELAWYESGAGFTRHVLRAAPVYTQFSTDMQAADIDGDGDIDIVVGDGGGAGNILWFENPRLNTPAGLGSDPRVGANWKLHVIGTHGDWVHDIETADLDLDGRPEVVTSGSGHTWVWRLQTNGSWTGRDLSSMAGKGVFLGDIDGDGRTDIATHTGWIRTPADLMVGVWTLYPTNSVTGDEVMLADLNRDGRLDAVRCDAHQKGPVLLYLAPANPQSATWSTTTIDPAMGAHHPEPADFDGDGRVDILMGLELQDLSVYRNLGGTPPTFTKIQLDVRAAHNARVGDLNGDGRPDVFGCDYIGHPPAIVYIQRIVAAPTITQLTGGQNCSGGTVLLDVAYSPQGPTSYSWSRGTTALVDGASNTGSVVSGATTFALTIDGAGADEAGDYVCVVTDACGLHTSNTFALSICAADVTCDGGVDINDLLVFLSYFAAGDHRADLDNGTATGTRDGGVDINDLLFFLARFAAGC